MPTKSFVKIGITNIFCYNNKMFSSITRTFGCCSKIFGCSNKKFICCPQFGCRNKTIFFRDLFTYCTILRQESLPSFRRLGTLKERENSIVMTCFPPLRVPIEAVEYCWNKRNDVILIDWIELIKER